MKTLYITRHAKSSWEEHVDDHKRPLSERGKLDLVLVSNYVALNFKKPHLILSSDANRALTTALAFKKTFGINDAHFIPSKQLYDFSGNQVMEAILNTHNDINILMIFGHNYGLTHLVNKLGNRYIDNLPTCGFVSIQFEDTMWQTITRGTTVATVFPKDLR